MPKNIWKVAPTDDRPNVDAKRLDATVKIFANICHGVANYMLLNRLCSKNGIFTIAVE